MAKLSKGITNIIVIVVVLAIVAGGVYYFLLRDDGMKTVKARFTQAVGVYPGTPVRILGVQVGDVTGVHPKPTYVEVDMEYDSKYKLPKEGGAYEVANSLVSDRYIQLSVYRSGATMASGATIEQKHTGGPSELDDIYAALDKLSVALGPTGANKGGKTKGALSDLLNVAAANLNGNGTAIGNSVTQLASAARTLADNRNGLFGTVKNLAQFTKTLKNNDSAIRSFNKLLAQVSGDLADERGDLGAALHSLAITLDAVQSFITKRFGKFHKDIKALGSVLGTVVKQKASVNETLAVAPIALANLVHLYDANPGALATRSNLASLTNVNLKTTLEQVCGTLTSLTGGVLNIGGLGALGGNVKAVCDQIAGSAGSLPSSSTAGNGSVTGGMLIGGGS